MPDPASRDDTPEADAASLLGDSPDRPRPGPAPASASAVDPYALVDPDETIVEPPRTPVPPPRAAAAPARGP